MKPTYLWSNASWIDGLQDEEFFVAPTAPTKSLAVTRVTSSGRKAVTGKKAELKESQAYPIGFGTRLAELFLENRPAEVLEDDVEWDDGALAEFLSRELSTECWEDAEFGDVFSYIGRLCL